MTGTKAQTCRPIAILTFMRRNPLSTSESRILCVSEFKMRAVRVSLDSVCFNRYKLRKAPVLKGCGRLF